MGLPPACRLSSQERQLEALMERTITELALRMSFVQTHQLILAQLPMTRIPYTKRYGSYAGCIVRSRQPNCELLQKRGPGFPPGRRLSGLNTTESALQKVVLSRWALGGAVCGSFL